ncbi:hypothetical protein [Haliscomenobacter sp.]|uniref:hypothetical protein n=1 Tax=Haliscomenobacter sp. TaxID=2717303 RepID=UPI003364C0AF
MMDPIYSIIERLALIEGKSTPVSVQHGLNQQQKGVPQLPALFKPQSISTTLTKKPYQKHPADGYMVGDSVEPRKPSLEEAMQEVGEDMVSRVKGQFADYLEKLEKENKLDSHLVNKAKHDLNIGDDGEVDENATWDQEVQPIGDPADTEVAHGVEDHIAASVAAPAAPMSAVSESPARTYTLEDGTCLECYGNDELGYEVRHGERSLPTRFPRIDHADMAVRLFQKRRQKQDLSQDYIEER